MELDKNITDDELHQNAAYISTSLNQREPEEIDNIYELPDGKMPPNCEKNAVKLNQNRKETVCAKFTSTVIANIALVLSLLALMAAIALAIYVYFSTQGTLPANSLLQGNLKNVSILEREVQILQAELINQANSLRQDYFQNISILEQKVQLILAELNNQANASGQDFLQNISALEQKAQTFQAELENLDALTLSTWTMNPVFSCNCIPPGSPSGDYCIQTNATCKPVQVYSL